MMSRQHRSVQEMLVAALRTPFGDLVARPWFDALALNAIAYWFFPLSRLWAAARASQGSVDRFLEETGVTPSARLARRIEDNLITFERVRHQVLDIERAWDGVVFGDGKTADQVVQAEGERLEIRNRYNNLRRAFIPLRLAADVQPVRWQIPSPDDVARIYGPLLQDPAEAFAPPETMPDVRVSRRLPKDHGGHDYWIQFRSPAFRLNDVVTARVHEPAGSPENAPTLIFGHGICVEFDHWKGLVDEVETMVRLGIRVVRPEAPWHGRRLPDGMYGGEKFIATAPMGALDLFTSAAREWSVIIDWLRTNTATPNAIGGSSLGAMTSQIISDKARHWPARLRPDAAFLVTHCGHIEDAVVHGRLAKAWGIGSATMERGWRTDLIRRYMPLLEAEGQPIIPPENIVTVLGDRDNVTPYDSARLLVDEWRVPARNRFVYRRGHFSVPVGMLRDHRPVERLRQVLAALAAE